MDGALLVTFQTCRKIACTSRIICLVITAQNVDSPSGLFSAQLITFSMNLHQK